MGFTSNHSLTIIRKASKPRFSIVYKTYWKFAHQRHKIYVSRVNKEPPPWTNDPVLSRYKFTNVFRASDRVSQYLIKNILYHQKSDLNDQFFRTLLFKIFNKIETWQYLEQNIGDITYSRSIFHKIERLLEKLKNKNVSIYSPAYIMPSGGKHFRFPQKHIMHLNLLKIMMKDRLPQKIHNAKNMKEAFYLLKEYPTIGDFLAYQFIIDLNYGETTNFSEMEFVIPGPGAKDGLRKCFKSFGDLNESDIIRYVTENQDKHCKKFGISPPSLWGRPLQLIDCQNIFCEVDKYARVTHPNIKGLSGRIKIKQRYRSKGNLDRPFFPPKWNIKCNIGPTH